MKKLILCLICFLLIFLLAFTPSILINDQIQSNQLNKSNNINETTTISINNSMSSNQTVNNDPTKSTTTTSKLGDKTQITSKITESTNKTTTKSTVKTTTTSTNTTSTTTTIQSLKSQNQQIIDSIYNTYGFKVSYNTGEYYSYYGVESPQLTDEEVAKDMLNSIKSAASYYPSGFFRNIKAYDGFRVVLYDSIDNGNVSGIADPEIAGDYKMILSAHKFPTSRIFFHESWHMMEYYMYYNHGEKFTSWNSYNPTDFSYGSYNTSYTPAGCSYDQNYNMVCSNPSNITFVSDYAQSKASEDRAETFADYMYRSYAKNYMASGFGINNKMKYLALTTRNYIPNSSGARWEKFIIWE
jgi:hypothetical protein